MYTSNISNYASQNSVLEYLSKLRTSKITLNLGFRIEYFYYIRQSCWLLKLMVQIYNYITSNIFINMCFGNSITNQQHKHKLLGPDVAWTSLTLTRDAPGSKSFSPSPGPQKTHTVGRGRPRSWRGRPWPEGSSKNFVQSKFALIFLPLTMRIIFVTLSGPNYSGSGKWFPGIKFWQIADFIAGWAQSGIDCRFQ